MKRIKYHNQIYANLENSKHANQNLLDMAIEKSSTQRLHQRQQSDLHFDTYLQIGLNQYVSNTLKNQFVNRDKEEESDN